LAISSGWKPSSGASLEFRYGPRLIDLDILLYDDLQLKTPGLTILTRAWPSAPSCWYRWPTWRPICARPEDLTVAEMLARLDRTAIHVVEEN